MGESLWSFRSLLLILAGLRTSLGYLFPGSNPNGSSVSAARDVSPSDATVPSFFFEVELSPKAIANAPPAAIGACYLFGYVVGAAQLSTYGLAPIGIVCISYLSAGIWLFSLFVPFFSALYCIHYSSWRPRVEKRNSEVSAPQLYPVFWICHSCLRRKRGWGAVPPKRSLRRSPPSIRQLARSLDVRTLTSVGVCCFYHLCCLA